jgi:hypothetical protein
MKTIERITTKKFDNLMYQIKRTNDMFRSRQEDKTYITVNYIPTEYVLGFDWAFECTHQNPKIEVVANDYMTLEGAKQYESEVVVCEDCESYFNEIDERWYV